MRFRVICKSWNSLIKSSTFISTHLRSAEQFNTENDVHLLLLQGYADETSHLFYSLHWNDPELSEYTNLVPPIYSTAADLIGTCNGLVCLSNCFVNVGYIILWKPSIRKFVSSSIPLCCVYGDESYAFGYDSHNNDYKVLLLTYKLINGQDEPVGKVWSLASGAWKSLSSESHEKIDVYNPFLDGLASVNSSLHWLQYDLTKEDDYTISTASFDLVTETFVIQEGMMVKETLSALRISRYGETLALFESVSYENEETLDMWVMKEYGEQCWTKFLTIRHGLPLEPFGFKKSREVVVALEDELGRLLLESMDMDSEEVKQFGRDEHEYYYMDSFIESLVLLDHPNVISY